MSPANPDGQVSVAPRPTQQETAHLLRAVASAQTSSRIRQRAATHVPIAPSFFQGARTRPLPVSEDGGGRRQRTSSMYQPSVPPASAPHDFIEVQLPASAPEPASEVVEEDTVVIEVVEQLAGLAEGAIGREQISEQAAVDDKASEPPLEQVVSDDVMLVPMGQTPVDDKVPAPILPLHDLGEVEYDLDPPQLELELA